MESPEPLGTLVVPGLEDYVISSEPKSDDHEELEVPNLTL